MKLRTYPILGKSFFYWCSKIVAESRGLFGLEWFNMIFRLQKSVRSISFNSASSQTAFQCRSIAAVKFPKVLGLLPLCAVSRHVLSLFRLLSPNMSMACEASLFGSICRITSQPLEADGHTLHLFKNRRHRGVVFVPLEIQKEAIVVGIGA